MKADAIVNEVPMVKDLGKDGPIPKELRDRLENDLDRAQNILGSMRDICETIVGEGDDGGKLMCALEAMAYRAGRMLEAWTGSGYFGDDKERRVEAAQGVTHG